MPALDAFVPAAFGDRYPNMVPTHVVCIIEYYDPEQDSVELAQLCDDDLRTWGALGMASIVVAQLSHAMVLDPSGGDDPDAG
jgi:hypothetical protein